MGGLRRALVLTFWTEGKSGGTEGRVTGTIAFKGPSQVYLSLVMQYILALLRLARVEKSRVQHWLCLKLQMTYGEGLGISSYPNDCLGRLALVGVPLCPFGKYIPTPCTIPPLL